MPKVLGKTLYNNSHVKMHILDMSDGRVNVFGPAFKVLSKLYKGNIKVIKAAGRGETDHYEGMSKSAFFY